MERLEDFLKAAGGCPMQLYHVVSESELGTRCIPIKRADMKIVNSANRPLPVLLPLIVRPVRMASASIHSSVTPATLQFSAPTAHHHDNTCEMTFCAQAPVMSVGRSTDVPTQVQDISSTQTTASEVIHSAMYSEETILASGQSETQSHLEPPLLRTLLQENALVAPRGIPLQGQNEAKECRSAISEIVFPKQQNVWKAGSTVIPSSMLNTGCIQVDTTVRITTGSYSTTTSCKPFVGKYKGLPNNFPSKDLNMRDTRATGIISDSVTKLESTQLRSHPNSSNISCFKVVNSQFNDLQGKDIRPIVIAPLLNHFNTRDGKIENCYPLYKQPLNPITTPLNRDNSETLSTRPHHHSERRFMKFIDLAKRQSHQPSVAKSETVYSENFPKKLCTDPLHHDVFKPKTDLPMMHSREQLCKSVSEPHHLSRPLTINMPIPHPEEYSHPVLLKEINDMLVPQNQRLEPRKEPLHSNVSKEIPNLPVFCSEKSPQKPTKDPLQHEPFSTKVDMPIVCPEENLLKPKIDDQCKTTYGLSKPASPKSERQRPQVSMVNTSGPLPPCNPSDVTEEMSKPLPNDRSKLPIVIPPKGHSSSQREKDQHAHVIESSERKTTPPTKEDAILTVSLAHSLSKPLPNDRSELPIVIPPKGHSSSEKDQHAHVTQSSERKTTPPTKEDAMLTVSLRNEQDKMECSHKSSLPHNSHTYTPGTTGLDVHVSLASEHSPLPSFRIDNVFSLASPGGPTPVSGSPWQQTSEISPATQAAARALWRESPGNPEADLTRESPWRDPEETDTASSPSFSQRGQLSGNFSGSRDPEETDTASSPSLSQTGQLFGTFSGSLEPEVAVEIHRAWWISDDDLMLSDIKEEKEEFNIETKKDHLKKSLDEIGRGRKVLGTAVSQGQNQKSCAEDLKILPKPTHSPIDSTRSELMADQPKTIVGKMMNHISTNKKQLNSDLCNKMNTTNVQTSVILEKRSLANKDEVKSAAERSNSFTDGGEGYGSQVEKERNNTNPETAQLPCSLESLKCLFQGALSGSEDAESPGQAYNFRVNKGSGDAPQRSEESRNGSDMNSQVSDLSFTPVNITRRDATQCSCDTSLPEKDCLQWVCDTVGHQYLLKMPTTMRKWMSRAKASGWKLQMNFNASPESGGNTGSPNECPSQIPGCTKDTGSSMIRNVPMGLRESSSNSACDAIVKPQPLFADSVMIRIKDSSNTLNETKPPYYEGMAKVMACSEFTRGKESQRCSPKKLVDLKRRVLLDAVKRYSHKSHQKELQEFPTQGPSNSRNDDSSESVKGRAHVPKSFLGLSAPDASVNGMENSSIERLGSSNNPSTGRPFESDCKVAMQIPRNLQVSTGGGDSNFPPCVSKNEDSILAECLGTDTSGSIHMKTQEKCLQSGPEFDPCSPKPCTVKITPQNEGKQFLWSIKANAQIPTQTYLEKSQIANIDGKSNHTIHVFNRRADEVLCHLLRTQDDNNSRNKAKESSVATSQDVQKVPLSSPHANVHVHALGDSTIKKSSNDKDPLVVFNNEFKSMMYIPKCENYQRLSPGSGVSNSQPSVLGAGDSVPSDTYHMAIDNTQYLEYMCQHQQWPSYEPYMRTAAEHRIKKLKDLKREQEEEIEKFRCTKKQKLSKSDTLRY